ncbi:hypothetical protein BOX15_Mlig016320g1 [Macrostomum lignano]|uniref:C2 domain-containing protein n=2 Tax=Macrostomum lignano TaxID=282301 RepID=A0A267ELA1_9PLAT|nr:hypothetical protein BOX15_Mlig016320g1 [Macrostomum lignano]
MQEPTEQDSDLESDDSYQGSDTGYSETCSSNQVAGGGGGGSGGFGVSSQPELFLGLAYSATTGQLMAEVIKGSAFRLAGSSRAPDTFVKLTVQSAEGRSLFKSRTPTFTCNPNPMWKENFVYPINKSQLARITLKVGVWAKKAMKRRHLIGCFALGRGGLGEEEKSHWQDMTEARGEQICRWHRLVAEDKNS